MCTLEKRGNIYFLTLTGDDVEHRLNPSRLDSIRSALETIRTEINTTSSSSAVLITTATGKFFSNGYDLAWANNDKSRHVTMSGKLRHLVRDLITLPVPTIAAVTGHAAAAGMILALAHDYVFMRGDRGFLYMSEVDIGLTIPAWFERLLRAKIGNPKVVRDAVLKAEKMTAVVAAERGVVDKACCGAAETVAAAVEVAEGLVRRRWIGHVYGGNRAKLLADVVDALAVDETVEDVENAIGGVRKARL